jgi:hypothetical protein
MLRYFTFLQEIKASHVAIEAPLQVLLKLSMISIGILDLPGKKFINSDT